MISKFRSLRALPPQRRRLLIEATWCLLRASFQVRFLQLKQTTKTLGEAQSLDDHTSEKSGMDAAIDVGRTVELVANNVPWRANCLPQAIAVKWMLQRRDIPCTLYFGAKDTRREDGSLDAHAWVAIANRVIIGGAESKHLKPISAFA